MAKKLTISDIPSETLEKMYAAIEEDDQYIKLKQIHQELLRRRDYVGAAKQKQYMEKVKVNVVNTYLANWEGELTTMNELTENMPPEDRSTLAMYTTAMSFLCDMIVTYSMDANQLLKKYYPDYEIREYPRLTILAEECKAHISHLDNAVDVKFAGAFGDIADELKELVDNKVKKLQRITNKLAARK